MQDYLIIIILFIFFFIFLRAWFNNKFTYFKKGVKYLKKKKAAKALKYFKLAAEKGDPIAMYNVGAMYLKGEGTLQDLFDAALWLKKANTANGKEPYKEMKQSKEIKKRIASLWKEYELWNYKE